MARPTMPDRTGLVPVIYRHAAPRYRTVKLLLDILQGAGLAAAAGIRPFLPTLVGGGLAAGDLGVDFEGTQYEFLEEPWFLMVVAIGLVFSVLMAKWIAENDALSAAIAGIGAGLGGVHVRRARWPTTATRPGRG